MKWVERKFMFSGLEGTFDNILERLEGTPLRLMAKTNNLSKEQLTISAAGWSVQVHAGHLLTLEELWLSRVQDFLSGAEVLTPWEETNSATEKADFNSLELSAILGRFGMTRMALVGSLRQLSGQEEALQSNHPRLQTPMRLLDLAYFVAEHDDHHLACIHRLVNSEFRNQN